MTLFPAIVVFAIVFLSFSKKILIAPEEPQEKPESKPGVANPLLQSDTLLKYELLRGLERKS